MQPLTGLVGIVFASALSTGCAACGDCGHKLFGGGEFTVTLAGPIEGEATGVGYSQSELDRIIEDPQPHWSSPRETYENTGVLGGVYAKPRHSSDLASFVGAADIPAGSFRNCEDATLMVVYVTESSDEGGGGQGFIELHDPDERLLLAGGTLHPQFSRGRDGEASFEVRHLEDNALTTGFCWTDPEAVLDVHVAWHVDRSVKNLVHEECPGLLY